MFRKRFATCVLNAQNPANDEFAGFCYFIRCTLAEREGM